MNETPIFEQVSETFKALRDTAFKHGYLSAQLELLDYIQTELKAKRLSPSKGLKNIIDKLANNE